MPVWGSFPFSNVSFTLLIKIFNLKYRTGRVTEEKVTDAPYGVLVFQSNCFSWLSSKRIPIDQFATYNVRGANFF